MSKGSVLVVDDDEDLLGQVVAVLQSDELATVVASSGKEALVRLQDDCVDVVLTDLRMPNMGGLELLREVRKDYPDLPVIMMTAHGTVEAAVDAMKAGASDFVLKPLNTRDLIFAVNKAVTQSRNVRASDGAAATPSNMVGDSATMDACRALISKAARGTATVLIRGESGTGKELAARAIHLESARADKPFVKVHCAALPDNLLESELFGYEKGAFSGAANHKPGRIDVARGGTLFLDEIGDITPAVQVKLLRVLQDKEYERLGGTVTHQADVRFVAATHRNLEKMVGEGTFREDLFYRLNVIPVIMPPLRKRGDDVVLLANHMLRVLREANNLPELVYQDGALPLFAAYPWPGNVRQLVNLVERLVVLSDGVAIRCKDIDAELNQARQLTSQPAAGLSRSGSTLEASRHDAEREAIAHALRSANGNRTLAARILGVSRRTLYNKLEAYDLVRRETA